MVSSLAGKLCHHLLYTVHAQSHRGAAGLPEAPPASGVSAPLSACGGHPWHGLPYALAAAPLLLLQPVNQGMLLHNQIMLRQHIGR